MTTTGIETDGVQADALHMVAREDHYGAGYHDPLHSHESGQLSLSLSGVMTVTVEDTSFVLPPNRAIWIPAGCKHQSVIRSDLVFQFVFIDPKFVGQPRVCRVFETTPLLRALIGEMTEFETSPGEEDREAAIVDLLLGEIARMPSLPVSVPLPQDKRLRRVCDAIMANPADPRDIDGWASEACMSRRTFTRIFSEQTGMGLATWRRQVRVMEAASRIAAGESIAKVSFDVGYENPSAFTAMFHRTFGANPSTYCRPG